MITGNINIPSSSGFWSRWRLHLSHLRKGDHHSIHLQRAYNKYGEDNMKFDILEFCNNSICIKAREQYWMDKYNCCKNGYNILPFAGRTTGRPIVLNRNGKQVSQYSLNGELLSVFASAREATRQTKISYKGISLCCKGITNTAYGYIWRYKNDSFDKFKLPKKSMKSKPIYQYDKNLKNIIKKYKTMTEAARITNTTISNISMCIAGIRPFAGGYVWSEMELI
jgi:group I intron endonuclease